MSTTLPDFWKLATSELTRANADRRHPFRHVVMATCTMNMPSQRTVVMRKFDPEKGLLIYTDNRSQKFSDLQEHPANAASLLFWHPRKKLQISMAGQVSLTMNKEDTLTHWRQVPAVSKPSYTTQKPPGSIIDAPADVAYDALAEDGRYFAPLLFYPRSVQLLQLNQDFHLRAGFSLENEAWAGHWLVP